MKKRELLELIQKLTKRVEELEKRPVINFPVSPLIPRESVEIRPLPYISIPSVWGHQDLCTDGQPHDWNYPWNAITPAPCKKCGKPAQTYTVTCGTLSSNKLQDMAELDYDNSLDQQQD